jgi:hypothetical protein
MNKPKVTLCPNCGRRVEPVTQSISCLNSDQFDAVKAGDWYCTACPEDVGTAKKSISGFAYFWDKDIAGVVENEIVNDYFNVKRRAAIARDKLLEMFGISERNEYEVKDLRDRSWALEGQSSINTTYVRFSLPDDSSTAARISSETEHKQSGLVLVEASFDIGGPIYFLFKESNKIDRTKKHIYDKINKVLNDD